MATSAHATRLETGRRLFTRIVVGIDGSQQSLEAARQAALLQDVDGQLTLFSVPAVGPRSELNAVLDHASTRADA